MRTQAALLLLLTGACATSAPSTWSAPADTIRDRMHGGWAGQMIGVSYGAPYEFRAKGTILEAPIRDWEPAFVSNSLGQDDLYVEMTFLRVLDEHGPDATWEQAGRAFRDSRYRLWHANHAARTNLRAGILPPASGHPRNNPHADDIDFQIEADVCGLVAPGMPEAATALCEVFGRIMNWGDGLYGGRFVAAMYSHAYREADAAPAAVRRTVEAGLDAIPRDSAYAAVIRSVLASFARDATDWHAAWRAVEERWGTGDLCPDGRGRAFNIDAKVNGAYIAIGLLYGGGDFARTLEIATRCGQDADCNPSNAAGVLGTLLGYSRIPRCYTDGLAGLAGRKFEYTDYDVVLLLATSERVARRVLTRWGGRVLAPGGVEIWEIPGQSPEPPATLEQMSAFDEATLAAWAAEFERREAAAPRAPD